MNNIISLKNIREYRHGGWHEKDFNDLLTEEGERITAVLRGDGLWSTIPIDMRIYLAMMPGVLSDQQLNLFADQCVALLGEACDDEMKMAKSDPVSRASLVSAKCASLAAKIACNQDPLGTYMQRLGAAYSDCRLKQAHLLIKIAEP